MVLEDQFILSPLCLFYPSHFSLDIFIAVASVPVPGPKLEYRHRMFVWGPITHAPVVQIGKTLKLSYLRSSKPNGKKVDPP